MSYSENEFSHLQKFYPLRLKTFSARKSSEASKIKQEQWINSIELNRIDKKDIQNNERSDGKVTSRKTENHLLQEKMKESSYLETSVKIQKYRATVLQLLDMHNLKRELITCRIRQTCDVHKP